MGISDKLKIDKAWKFVQGLGVTSSNKEFYEEDVKDGGFSLHAKDVYVDNIPVNPPAESNSVIEKNIDFELKNDLSVTNNLSWYASVDGSSIEQIRNTRLKDWISPKFGQAYTVILKDATGRQIFTTDPINWVFDYKTGILVCENDPSDTYQLPLRISGYRYIGNRIVQDENNASWLKIRDDGNLFADKDLETVLQQLGGSVQNIKSELNIHINQLLGAHVAGSIAIDDIAGHFESEDVEGALQEIAESLSTITGQAVDISISDPGNKFDATNVESALQELSIKNEENTQSIVDNLANINVNKVDITNNALILQQHIDSIESAHRADSIELIDDDNKFEAANVETALVEVLDNIDQNVSEVLSHINTVDVAHSAKTIYIEPVGDIESNNLQSVIEEISNEKISKDNLISENGASLIGIKDLNNLIYANNVEGALAEIANNVVNNNALIVDNSIVVNNLVLDLDQHKNSTENSHPASGIILEDFENNFESNNVEGALFEIARDLGNIVLTADNVTIADFEGNFESNNVENALKEVANKVTNNEDSIAINIADINELKNHVIAVTDAHFARAISLEDENNLITQTNVEDAIVDLFVKSEQHSSNITNHENRIVTNTENIDIASNLINEHLNKENGAHTAGNISINNSVFESDNVEKVLVDINDRILNNESIVLSHLVEENAHKADNILVVDEHGKFEGNNIENVLEELDDKIIDNTTIISNNEILLNQNIENLNTHINNSLDAHYASAISVLDSGDLISATEVEGALTELVVKINTNDSNINTTLQNHINSVTDAHNASTISIEDVDNLIVSNNVEEALNEVVNKANSNTDSIQSHVNGSENVHNARSISVSNANGLIVATNVENAIDEIVIKINDNNTNLINGLQSHISNTSDSHDASTISVLDSSELIEATEVESALTEIVNKVNNNSNNLQNHIDNTVDAHNASAISVLDTGDLLTATEVEGALTELAVKINTNDSNINTALQNHVSDFEDTVTNLNNKIDTNDININSDLNAHIDNGIDAHDASAISVLDTGDLLTATEVEGALTELAAKINANNSDISLALNTHIDNGIDAHDASAISINNSDQYLSSNNVESALIELIEKFNTNLDNHKNSLVNEHFANAIKIVDSSNIMTSSNVEDSLQEIMNKIIELNVNGTKANAFGIDISNTIFPRLKNENGVLRIRNAADSDDASLVVKDLTINGTLTTINSEVVTIADNILVLNSNVVNVPIENAGLEVERGDEINASIIWDEANDVWKAGLSGSEIRLLRLGDEILIDHNSLLNNHQGVTESDFPEFMGVRLSSIDIEKVIISDLNRNIITSNITVNELNSLSEIKGNIQIQIDSHINSSLDAHDASAISVLDTGDLLTATEVEGALTELTVKINTNDSNINTALQNHISYFEDTAANLNNKIDTNDSNINTALQNHIDNITDAHDASAISVLDTGDLLAATEVEGALTELAVKINTNDININTALQNHVSDFEDTVTNLNNKIDTNDININTALQNHIDNDIDAHDASAISVLDTGDLLTATEVEGALTELVVKINTNDSNINTALQNHISDFEDTVTNLNNKIDTNDSNINTALQNHIDNITDAHDASAISVLDTGDLLAATEVEGALTELAAKINANNSDISLDLNTHIDNGIDAHDASAISVLDTGDLLAATEVEGALAELVLKINSNKIDVDSALELHINDNKDAHDASSISILDSDNLIVATDVENAILEIVTKTNSNLNAINTNSNILQNHIDITLDAHDASAISVLDTGDLLTATEVESALIEIVNKVNNNFNNLQNHIDNITDAHDASSISILDSGSLFSDTDVESALSELAVKVNDNISMISNNSNNLQSHIDNGIDAHDASAISILDLGNLIGATEVEGALIEIVGKVNSNYSNLQSHIDNVIDAHDASAISVLDTGDLLTATEVEGALAELASKINNNNSNINTFLQAHIYDIKDAHDASSISILDSGNNYESDNVEDVLQEISEINDILNSNLNTLSTTVNNHLSIDSVAHNAGFIAIVDINSNYISSNVEGALEEIGNRISQNETNIESHVNSIVSHNANTILVEDVNNKFVSNNVEEALNEVVLKIESNDSNISDINLEISDINLEISDLNSNKVDKVGDDDIEITDFSKGIILRSPNGSRFRITVGDNGVLSTTLL